MVPLKIGDWIVVREGASLYRGFVLDTKGTSAYVDVSVVYEDNAKQGCVIPNKNRNYSIMSFRKRNCNKMANYEPHTVEACQTMIDFALDWKDEKLFNEMAARLKSIERINRRLERVTL